MATENKRASTVVEQSTEHLNQMLHKDITPEEDLVILDEKLRARIESQKNVAPLARTEDVEEMSKEETIAVADARAAAQVLDVGTGRRRARLLLITKDASHMQEGSESFRRMTDLRTQFLEIHVIVLTLKTLEESTPVLRLYDNVWLYTTNSTAWWRMGYDAYQLALGQLTFSGGFRADIIIADDVFESGLSAWFLSQKVKRPLQLHILEDFYDPMFIEEQAHPTLYEWSTEFLLKRVRSVRTKTEFQRQAVVMENKNLEPFTEMLPHYYNLEAWRDFVPTFDLRTKYPQFKFIMLHISSMRTSSHAREVLVGAASILRQYPSIGLVMLGSGPLRAVLEKTTIALGLQKQIEFEPMPTDIISYMKSANVLLHLSEDSEEDNLILEAAVAKLPMVANGAGLAGKLFVDGESAALCDIHDVKCVEEGINRYLNRNQDRVSFARIASEVVFERIEQDYTAYVRAYSQSIERCIVVES